MIRRIFSIVLAAGCLLACCQGCTPEIVVKDQVDVVRQNHGGIDKMLCQARVRLPGDARILVATFVDNDQITKTTGFGRLLGESAGGRLCQRGYNVVNVNLRQNSLVINEEGQFALSRDIRELGRNYEAVAVLVGTYTATRVSETAYSTADMVRDVSSQYDEGDRLPETIVVVPNSVYVSLRLIDASDSSVMAAYDYRILLDEGVKSLLQQ